MAVPVSFFHRDKARVDLGGGAAGLTVWPLVEDLPVGEGPVGPLGPVAEAKMKGFVLTEELYFDSIYWPFSFLQYIIIIFLNRSRK